MSRASQADAARHRVEIVEAASRQLRAGGATAVSVQSVTNAVGLTPGAFYRHFESKDDLIAAAAEESFNDILATMASDASTGDGWRKLVTDYLSPEHRDDRADGCANTALATDSARSDENSALRAVYADGVQRTLDALALFQKDPEGDEARRSRMLTLLTMSGALALSRATSGALSTEFLDIAREQLLGGVPDQ